MDCFSYRINHLFGIAFTINELAVHQHHYGLGITEGVLPSGEIYPDFFGRRLNLRRTGNQHRVSKNGQGGLPLWKTFLDGSVLPLGWDKYTKGWPSLNLVTPTTPSWTTLV
jgi:hypothetical protein